MTPRPEDKNIYPFVAKYFNQKSMYDLMHEHKFRFKRIAIQI
jgi:hypothetical protein